MAEPTFCGSSQTSVQIGLRYCLGSCPREAIFRPPPASDASIAFA